MGGFFSLSQRNTSPSRRQRHKPAGENSMFLKIISGPSLRNKVVAPAQPYNCNKADRHCQPQFASLAAIVIRRPARSFC